MSARRALVWASILLALVAVSCAAHRGDVVWQHAIAHIAAADSSRAVAERETARAEGRARALARAASIDSARWAASRDSLAQLQRRIRRDGAVLRVAGGVDEALGPMTQVYIAQLEHADTASTLALDAMAISRGAERAVAKATTRELAAADVQVATRDTAIALAKGGRCGWKCGTLLGASAAIVVHNAPRILRALIPHLH